MTESQAKRNAEIIENAIKDPAPTTDTETAGVFLGVSPRTVCRMCERGKLKAIKVMSMWRINKAALFEMLGINNDAQ